jgi:hypothetical protein
MRDKIDSTLLEQLRFWNNQQQDTVETEKLHTPNRFEETKSKVENFLSKLKQENEKLFQNVAQHNVEVEPHEESFIEMNIFIDNSLGQLVKNEQELSSSQDKPWIEEL